MFAAIVEHANKPFSPEAISDMLEEGTASDFHYEWQDCDRESHGSHCTADLWREFKELAPDVRCQIQRVTMKEGGFAARAYIDFEGSQTQPFLPIFPVNTRVRGVICSELEFDGHGQVRKESMHLCFEAPFEAHPIVIDFLAQSATQLALREGGSRMLQRAMEVAGHEECVTLCRQFRGHVWEASASPHANHVLQKCVVNLPPRKVLFIAEEFKGRAVLAARHSIRSRMLERFIEYFPGEVLDDLVGELIPEASHLCCNTFGNFVLQRLLEHGTDTQRRALVEVLSADAASLAKHSIASNVLSSAFIYCPVRDQRFLAEALCADAAVVRSLRRHYIASFVMRQAKRVITTPGRQGALLEISL
uniref:PUM-HD domain-containing protein n=1 Tax=Zooxanthella nutricula TaxID=1333877 RepID=A0A7S2PB02_9DINO